MIAMKVINPQERGFHLCGFFMCIAQKAGAAVKGIR
jgi:hypothetical protein